MARPKADQKGQKSLTSFFKKKKEKDTDSDVHVVPVDDAQAEMNVDDAAPEADNDADNENIKFDKKAAPGVSTLPPISDIAEIFKDIVSRIPEIKGVTDRVKGRKLRVATMCSGTESPLLALGLSQEYIEELYEVKLETQHVFSCEIEPFKQAYIERNFEPAILFRDICELGDDEA